MEAINITAYTSDIAQTKAIKAVMKAFKIKFEINNEKPYNPAFVAKIKKSKQEYIDGKGVVMTTEELKNLCK